MPVSRSASVVACSVHVPNVGQLPAHLPRFTLPLNNEMWGGSVCNQHLICLKILQSKVVHFHEVARGGENLHMLPEVCVGA